MNNPPYDYLDGALLAAPYEVWLRLKGIPDDYFLYWEDVVLGSRAHQHHISLKIIPNLGILHPPSSNPDKLYYLVRNGAHYMEHFSPWPGSWYWRLYNRLRYVYHSLYPPSEQRRIILRALRHAREQKLGKSV